MQRFPKELIPIKSRYDCLVLPGQANGSLHHSVNRSDEFSMSGRRARVRFHDSNGRTRSIELLKTRHLLQLHRKWMVV